MSVSLEAKSLHPGLSSFSHAETSRMDSDWWWRSKEKREKKTAAAAGVRLISLATRELYCFPDQGIHGTAHSCHLMQRNKNCAK